MKTTFYVGLLDRDKKEVNFQHVLSVVAESFRNFTYWQAIGYWQGSEESSLVIQINHIEGGQLYARSSCNDAELVARKIAALFNQTAVLVEHTLVDNRLVYNPDIGT